MLSQNDHISRIETDLALLKNAQAGITGEYASRSDYVNLSNNIFHLSSSFQALENRVETLADRLTRLEAKIGSDDTANGGASSESEEVSPEPEIPQPVIETPSSSMPVVQPSVALLPDAQTSATTTDTPADLSALIAGLPDISGSSTDPALSVENGEESLAISGNTENLASSTIITSDSAVTPLVSSGDTIAPDMGLGSGLIKIEGDNPLLTIENTEVPGGTVAEASTNTPSLSVGYDENGMLIATDYSGKEVFTLSRTKAAFNVPVIFNSAGGISIGYDIFLNNPLGGNSVVFKSQGTVKTESPWQDLDLTLSAANNGYVVVNDTFKVSLALSTTTAGTAYGQLIAFENSGAVATGTDTSFGSYTRLVRTGATGGAINTYGEYIFAQGDLGGTSTIYGSYTTASGTDMVYGQYIDVTATTTGTAYGLYVDAGEGEGKGYSAALMNGNVGIGTATPVTDLDINGLMRMKKYSSQPYECDTSHDGALAVTSKYQICICNGVTSTPLWISSADGESGCKW